MGQAVGAASGGSQGLEQVGGALLRLLLQLLLLLLLLLLLRRYIGIVVDVATVIRGLQVVLVLLLLERVIGTQKTVDREMPGFG